MKTITILTGAGISAESGLGTFRSKDGIWAKYDIGKVATPAAFRANPRLVHDFYNLRRKACIEATPNAAHHALARLQASFKGKVHLITQNVDDLHERAGAIDVIHMHGELMLARCASCGQKWPAPRRMYHDDLCAFCGLAFTRPDVVWFGEEIYHMEKISEAVRAADLFVVIGSSGQVYPAADFACRAKQRGAKTLSLNLEPAEREFDDEMRGLASEVVPEWVEMILARQT